LTRARCHIENVNGYVDSNCAGDLDKRRSLSGYVFILCNFVVSWKAILQFVVALSTTELEYISLTEGVKEAIWLRELVSNLGLIQDVTVIFCDSQTAIHLTKNQMYHDRTKNIDVRRPFVRDIVADNIVTVKKIDITHNPADMLTKAFI